MADMPHRQMRCSNLIVCCVVALTACGEEPGLDAGPETDAGFDAGSAPDAGPDDAGFDAGSDAGFDAGPSMMITFPPRDFGCAAGASMPCPTTVPVLTEAERTVEVTRDMPRSTFTYVISVLSMPKATFAGTAAGLNLDGMDSGLGSPAFDANCAEFNQDYTSLRDPGHPGLDNAFQGLIGLVEDSLGASACPGGVTAGCVDATLAARISDGNSLLLVEVTGLDSFVHDEAVQVGLYTAEVPGDGAPATEPDGTLSPGQTLSVVTTLIAPTDGDVFRGRLRVRWGDTLVPPPVPTGLFWLPNLDEPELRANISATGLELGVLGGTESVDSFVARAGATNPGTEDAVRSITESIADVTPTAADPTTCERISSGYFVEAVLALRL